MSGLASIFSAVLLWLAPNAFAQHQRRLAEPRELRGRSRSALTREAYNPDPENSAVKTEMGSGRFAAAGHPNVAYVRRSEFFDTSWLSGEPTGDDGFFAAVPFANVCAALGMHETRMPPEPVRPPPPPPP